MSRAFLKEDDAGLPEDLPERPVSPHPNLVTPEGLAAIDAEIARLASVLQRATPDLQTPAAAADQNAIAVAQRDLRYWTARRASAEPIDPPHAPARIQFGTTVTLRRADGRTQTFRIVGEDEADPARGTVSHVSPLARALFGKEAGDVVEVAGAETEVLKVE